MHQRQVTCTQLTILSSAQTSTLLCFNTVRHKTKSKAQAKSLTQGQAEGVKEEWGKKQKKKGIMCSSQVISHSYVTVEFCVCQAVMLKKERNKNTCLMLKGFPSYRQIRVS